MSSTARGVGLRVDWWVDERRDPVRSTDGAVRFLNYLRKQFGSMYLAAAAYNGGPGRVARGLVRYSDDLEGTTGDSLFFALAETDYLRRETRDYVPQLVAAALVGKASARYGVTPESLPPYVFDTVRVPAATPLSAVAVASGATLAEVADLNRHLLRGMTPPEGPSLVRVPVGRAAGFAVKLDALDDSLLRAFTRVTTRKGETMAHLAAVHRLTVKELGWYNRKVARTRKGTLVAGQVILIPSAAVVAGARDVPDPSIEKWGRPSRSRVRTHVVKSGETLASIANRFGTTSGAIMKLNKLKTKLIVPGQSLVVGGGNSSSAKKKPGKHAGATKAKPARRPKTGK
jgi:membrane-bound lytic murein transglycosylase D